MIDVPAASQVHRQVVRKDLDLPALVVDPLVTAHYLELAPPVLGADVASVADQLAAALADQHGVAVTTATTAVLRRAGAALAAVARSVGRAARTTRR